VTSDANRVQKSTDDLSAAESCAAFPAAGCPTPRWCEADGRVCARRDIAANGTPYRIELVVLAREGEQMNLALAVANAVDFQHVGPIIVQPAVILTSEEALRA